MLGLLIGYMFLFIHRPFEVWPRLGEMRIELLYMLLTMGVWIFTANKRWPDNMLHKAFLAFAAVVLCCWFVSPWSEKSYPLVENYCKLLVFYVMLVTVIHDEKSLKRVALAFLVIMMVYMAHSLLEYLNGRHVYRMGIVRLIGVDQSMSDPNSFGATVLYGLPLITPFWLCQPSRRLKYFLKAYVLLSITCIMLTGSRSSFVGLIFLGIITVWRSNWRKRLALLFIISTPLVWLLLPPSLQNRFETIIHPEVGPANAQTSAEGRIDGLLTGLKLFEKFPLTGCGPGAWRPATGSEIESHNLYGQLMGELGVMGILTFVMILVAFWMNLGWLRQTYRLHCAWKQDFLYFLGQSLGFSLLLLLFEGNFGHNLFRYSWLWFGGFLISARFCVQQRLAAESTDFVTHESSEDVAPQLLFTEN